MRPFADNQLMKSIDRHPWLAITLLLVSLFILHLSTISHQSYFTDEVEELHYAQGDFWKSVFMPDSMPPLFTLSLRSWLAVFGENVEGRWLSASFGMVSTFAIFVFIWRSSTAWVGLVTAALFAFNPLQLYYAQLIRGYAFMTCVSVFCIGFFLLALRTSKPRYFVAFTAFSVLGMYVHYYFAMIPIAIFVAWLSSRRWEQFPRLVACYVAIFVFTCPVLVFLIGDFQFQHNLRDPRPMSLSAVVYTYFSYFSGYALGPSQRELQYISTVTAIRFAVPWLLAVAAIALPLAVRGIGALKRNAMAALILSVLTVPLILIGTAGLLSGITYNVRFVAWFAFPLSVLFGFAFIQDNDRKLPRWVIACGVGLFGIFAIANFNRLFNSRYQFEDTRAAAKHLLAYRSEGEPVYVVSDYMLQPLAHYFSDYSSGGSEDLLELPQPGTRSRIIRDAESFAEAMSVVASKSHEKLSWLVYSRPFHGDPKGLILDEFIKRGATLEHRFAGIDIYRIPIKP